MMELVKLHRVILMNTVLNLHNCDKAVHTGTVRGECP